MTRALTKTYSFTREYNAILVYFLIAGSMILTVSYAFNIYSIVSKTATMKGMEKSIASTQSVVQDLDAQYIALSSKITPDMAKSFGLEQSTISAYIPRTPSLGSAQVLGRGI